MDAGTGGSHPHTLHDSLRLNAELTEHALRVRVQGIKSQ